MLLVRRRSSRADLLELFNEQREEQLDALLRQASMSRLEDAESEVDRLELVPAGGAGFRRLPRHGAAIWAAAHRGCGPLISPGRCMCWPPRTWPGHLPTRMWTRSARQTCCAPCSPSMRPVTGTGWNQRRGRGLDPADQRAAVAVATLLTAEGEDEALTIARLIPHFGGEPESRLLAIARWLAQLYPPPGGSKQLVIAPLEPDRLGEVLVGDVLKEQPGAAGRGDRYGV